MSKLIFHPRKDCKRCNGKGVVTDWVPYGTTMGVVQMETCCDCFYDGLTNEEVEAYERGDDYEFGEAV